MKFSLASALAILAVGASALPATSETPAMVARAELESRATTCTKSATDKLIFNVSMKSFQKARKAKNPSKCNWHSDNCSWSPDRPDGYNFIPACQRHDFGYRNTKAQKRFTKAMKKKVDDNFKKDLYNYCNGFSGIWSYNGVICRRYADIYVAFVRKYGKREEIVAEDGEVVTFSKREDNVFDIELDNDIPGQEIPEVLPEDEEGLEVEDLDAFYAEVAEDGEEDEAEE